MMYLVFILAAWWALARYDAREESAWSWPFRNLGSSAFPDNQKFHHVDAAHQAGGWFIATLAFMSACLFASLVNGGPAISGPWLLAFGYCFTACLAWYWLWFDVLYNIEAKMPGGAFYVGTTSKMDRWLRRWFGANPGRNKALACGVITAALLLLTYLHFGRL